MKFESLTGISGGLLSVGKARALDEEASAQWGLAPFALVEAAGRACAGALVRSLARNGIPKKRELSLTVLAGKGNNAADALVMLRTLILERYAQASSCAILVAHGTLVGAAADGDKTPLSEAMLAVRKLGVPVMVCDDEKTAALARADVIIDGITGTGLTGPLRGPALEMAQAVQAAAVNSDGGPYIVSIDVPSGNFDGWQPGMSILAAHMTLAIEPQKLCLYMPAARPYAGAIVPVGGLFPQALINKYRDAELVEWEAASARIPPVPPTAHKYERGLVEIRAGSPGAAGAARLAALGAQAAGAGLVRLIVDPSLYPVVAPACSGVMVVPDDEGAAVNDGAANGGAVNRGRFSPSASGAAAVLLGPGWGRGEDRRRLLESYLPLEKSGLPLILDADAITLAKDMTFNGNVLLTPHPGEFAAYTGLPKDEILSCPLTVLRRVAEEKNAHILLKGHVLYAASPDGRIGVIDGMNPALAAGGSGDVLAGFCAAAASRQKPFDGYACACAAASLLIRAASSESLAGRFFDPSDLTAAAAAIAGAAWMPSAWMTEAPHER